MISIKQRSTGELVNIWDLAKFLKEHEGEWWTPFEIKKEIGGDIRTIKNVIRRLGRRPWETTYAGWRLDIAERGKRLYVARIVRDIEGSLKLIKAEIFEVESIPDQRLEDIIDNRDLILEHVDVNNTRDHFLSYLEKARYMYESRIRLRNLTKLTDYVKMIKEDKLRSLNDYLNDLQSNIL